MAKFSFFSDWTRILRHRLQSAGYALRSRVSDEKVAIAYMNVLKRYVSLLPRTVLSSRELECPSQYEAGLEAIQKKAEKGEDLNPHLSNRLLRLDFHDPLLNHWGIHHFHLGADSNSDYFVERTGPLLFAHVTSTHLYFIQILGHGAWTNEALLEILGSNWPKLLERLELKNVLSPTERWSPDETQDLRNAGIVTPIALSNGKVYGPLGGGYTTSGVSTDVMQWLMHARSVLKEMEKIARAKMSPDRCDEVWHLVIEDREAYAESDAGKRIYLGQTSL